MNHFTQLPAVLSVYFFVLFINVKGDACVFDFCVRLSIQFCFFFLCHNIQDLLIYCRFALSLKTVLSEPSAFMAHCVGVSSTGLRFARALTSVCHLSAPWPAPLCQDSHLSFPRALSVLPH